MALIAAADPAFADAGEAAAALAPLDGLVLAGGADLDPAGYGAEPHPCTKGSWPERDAAEVALARAAIARDLPLLGICRGMQLLNVARGGTLVQHLPDDLGHTDHRRHLGSFDDADHDVRLAPGSLAARACGSCSTPPSRTTTRRWTRSGTGSCRRGWSVLDDLVEAIEAPDARWALGVSGTPRSTRRPAWSPRSCEAAPRRPAARRRLGEPLGSPRRAPLDRHPRGSPSRRSAPAWRRRCPPPAAPPATRGHRHRRAARVRAVCPVPALARAQTPALARCRCGPTWRRTEMPNDDPEALERRVRVPIPSASTGRSAAATPTLRLQRRARHARALPRLGEGAGLVALALVRVPARHRALPAAAPPERFPRGAAQIYATFDLGLIGYWAIPTAPPWYAAARG
jgi:putative glutamine amidotransferase